VGLWFFEVLFVCEVRSSINRCLPALRNWGGLISGNAAGFSLPPVSRRFSGGVHAPPRYTKV